VGSNGKEKVDHFSSEAQASEALEAWAEAQWRKGYSDL
jgi:predicted DNA-binding WGR domain protein